MDIDRFGDCDRQCVRFRGRRNIDADATNDSLLPVGHDVFEVVGSHYVTDEAETADGITWHNLHTVTIRHTDQANNTVSSANMSERVDTHIDTGIAEDDEWFGDYRNRSHFVNVNDERSGAFRRTIRGEH